MEQLKEMSLAFIMLIRLGVTARIVHSCIMIGANEEEAPRYKKRLKNAIIFEVCAELVWVIKDLVMYYYT